jgi:hypothetical protein
MSRQDGEAYNQVQRVKNICLESKTKQEAKIRLVAANLAYPWLRDFRPYMDLPEANK